MVIGIHNDRFDGTMTPFCQKYEEILKLNGIEYLRLDINDLNFWEKVRKCDYFIYRWPHYDNERQIAHTILPVIEYGLGIKCFPDQNTCWHFDDKIRQYYLLKENGFPILDSWIFWRKEDAMTWLRTADYPLVFKLKAGAGSTNVILIRSKHQAEKLVKIMFGKGAKSGNVGGFSNVRFDNVVKELHRIGWQTRDKIKGIFENPIWQREKGYILFQKFLPDNDFDTRITVIGNRAFCFRRFVRKKDFRASGSGMISYDQNEINKECIKIAFSISKKLNFQSMAYDFIFDGENAPHICEISYTYQDKAVYDCPGYWDSDLQWHDGHFWPQYLHLKDLLDFKKLITIER